MRVCVCVKNMKMTIEDFNKVRPLQWTIREYGSTIYNTPIDQTETRLFWLDFMRNVFAPKFSNQQAVTYIASFDVTQPVLMTDDLTLKLPTQLETVIYYADNKTLPKIFSINNVSNVTATFVGVVVLLILLVVSVVFSGEKSSSSSSSSSLRNKIVNIMHAKVI